MFRKTLYEMRFRLIVFIVFFLLLLIGLVLIRPIVANMMVSVDMNSEEMQQLPEFLKNFVSQSTIENSLYEDDQFFLMSQWFGKNFGQFLPFLALIIAFPVFARETEKKTIYLLLSRRSRKEIFDTKVFSAYAVLLVLIVIFSFFAPVLMMLSGYDVFFNADLMQIIVQQIISATFFYFLFALFSVVFNDQIKPVILGIVLIFAMPFSSMIHAISCLNLYPYIFGRSVFVGSGFDWKQSLFLLALTAALYVIGKSLFLRKEF